jgi:hypothetical protein
MTDLLSFIFASWPILWLMLSLFTAVYWRDEILYRIATGHWSWQEVAHA